VVVEDHHPRLRESEHPNRYLGPQMPSRDDVARWRFVPGLSDTPGPPAGSLIYFLPIQTAPLASVLIGERRPVDVLSTPQGINVSPDGPLFYW